MKCMRGVFAVVLICLLTVPLTSDALTVFFTDTNGTSWTVPSIWLTTNNAIAAIGGGAGGIGNAAAGGSAGGDGGDGGGGGAYSVSYNVPLTPESNVTLKVGAFGGNAASGGDSYFCRSTSNCASIAGTNVVVGAKGGSVSTGTGGAGGAAGSGVGSTTLSGGNGAAGAVHVTTTGGNGGGGGGAAGPNGAGGNAVTTTGGTADGGTIAGGTSQTIGNSGTEWDATHGSGSGSGAGLGAANGLPGGSAGNNTAGIDIAGNGGGFYGGGGGGNGGGGKSSTNGNISVGTGGLIVITFPAFGDGRKIRLTGKLILYGRLNIQ